MTIVVRYFAILRERKGLAQEKITVAKQVSVEALYLQLFGEQACVGLRFAVNQTYVSASHLINDGDEVAFLPPLGGG